MPTFSNPSDLARETLRLLAARRIPPTPDNYQQLYFEIAGSKEHLLATFPEKQIRELATALPRTTPQQVRLARQIEQAAKSGSWQEIQSSLLNFANSHRESQNQDWGELIVELLQQWETKHAALTPAKKREAIEHLIAGTDNNSEALHARLGNLVRSWAQVEQRLTAIEPLQGPDTLSPIATRANAANAADASIALGELRELLSYTLETVLACLLVDSEPLASEAKALGQAVRNANNSTDRNALASDIRKFACRLELLADERSELKFGLVHLLQLLVENVGELVADDGWLRGQLRVLNALIATPLTPRAIEDVERRLREVVFKQSQLKQNLDEAKEALRRMLTSFVDRLVEFAESTSGYHDKMEACARKISTADNIGQLSDVINEVMHETRVIQVNAQRSRDELLAARQQVETSERRITDLESELEKTSAMMRHDQLTGALNRRGLDEMYEREVARALRRRSPLCLAMLDIDNFKRLNDTHGHDAGDAALIHLATVMRDNLRPQDSVARYGGEEFLILLPDATLDDATRALTRLQRELTRRFFLLDNQKILITFSAGVTVCREDDQQADAVKRADEAMYEAKRAGKNRVLQA